MSLLPSHRIGLMYDRAPIRDPVAYEQPFGGRGGELSPQPRARMLETLVGVLSRLFSVPYFFLRSFRYTASYRHGYLDFQMYRGGGRQGL